MKISFNDLLIDFLGNEEKEMDENNVLDSRNVIILHPDYETLKAEVEKLRTELSMLVLERDHLLY